MGRVTNAFGNSLGVLCLCGLLSGIGKMLIGRFFKCLEQPLGSGE